MKTYKVADIVGQKVFHCEQRRLNGSDLAAMLANLDPVQNPKSNASWILHVVVGTGNDASSVQLSFPNFISTDDSLDSPIFLRGSMLVFFKNRLFCPEREPVSAEEREEIILRVKKAIFDEETELVSLRAAVANLEAAIEYSKSGPRREAINEDVKLVVWARDGGACVRCGSKKELHFDHIIPFAKGGGNSETNIQILCQVCNLKKSDKIAMA